MNYYQIPIFLATCVICLGSPTSGNAFSNVSTNSSIAEKIAQASTNNSTIAPSSSANTAYDRYMKAGYEASEQKNYQAALENFKKALEERPNDIYAQQAIHNIETYLAKVEGANDNGGLWWMILGVALAVAIGGGVFFFSGLLRKTVSEEKEQDFSENSPEVAVNYKSRGDRNNFEPDSRYGMPTLPPESSSNHFDNNHSASDNGDDSSALPLQTTTRLPNLDVIDELIQDLQEPDPKKRRKAIWELAQKGDSRAMKPLVDLMLDSDSQERSLILEALSQISIRTLKPMNQALAISLQDKNPQVRKNAIRDLTRIYDLMSQISQMLRHAMDDSDAEVQETARWALSQLNLQMTPTRLDLLPMQQNETMP
jgi:tetratricopeptide (TPR) repeat protein